MSDAPRALDGYPSRSTDKVRYADTDRQGHVNNSVFAVFIETGRVELLYDPEAPMAEDGAEFVIARLSVDFRAEVQWPGTIETGTGVERIGRSSVTLVQSLFQGDVCVATAETVIVQLDSATRKSRPFSDVTRARLEAMLVKG